MRAVVSSKLRRDFGQIAAAQFGPNNAPALGQNGEAFDLGRGAVLACEAELGDELSHDRRVDGSGRRGVLPIPLIKDYRFHRTIHYAYGKQRVMVHKRGEQKQKSSPGWAEPAVA